jgi:predicted phage-related endonuclease
MTEQITDRPKVGAYEWMGEQKDLAPERGWQLLARYRTAAAALHAAKETAKQIEQEIMEELEGFEHGAINGQQVFHWSFVDSTSFDAKTFKEDPERLALYRQFLTTKVTRRFKVDGTVGVD